MAALQKSKADTPVRMPLWCSGRLLVAALAYIFTAALVSIHGSAILWSNQWSSLDMKDAKKEESEISKQQWISLRQLSPLLCL